MAVRRRPPPNSGDAEAWLLSRLAGEWVAAGLLTTDPVRNRAIVAERIAAVVGHPVTDDEIRAMRGGPD